jgi:hypothetical protein
MAEYQITVTPGFEGQPKPSTPAPVEQTDYLHVQPKTEADKKALAEFLAGMDAEVAKEQSLAQSLQRQAEAAGLKTAPASAPYRAPAGTQPFANRAEMLEAMSSPHYSRGDEIGEAFRAQVFARVAVSNF